jgi:hypothetical protein
MELELYMEILNVKFIIIFSINFLKIHLIIFNLCGLIIS